jgi:2-polyprenyl-3-methyl-5-hydroxy-6-metoxy-1,4-benzoquinol methylase
VAVEARWNEEAKFFDQWAQQRISGLEPLDPAVLERYRKNRGLYSKEACMRLLGDPRGKRILDVGCGDGENSVLLAKLGARVTGLDVSPGAIEMARRRAALNGVEVDFVCSPVEKLAFRGEFDVIWVDNMLHHVLPALDETLGALARAAKPGALFIAAEPLNLSPLLRKVRFLVPVHTEVTPGERPLEPADLEVVRRHLPDLRWEHFNFLARFMRFILPNLQYELASKPRKLACDALALIDRLVLSAPGLAKLGGVGVIHGHLA